MSKKLKYSSVDHYLEEKLSSFSNVVKTLGVTLDAELSVEQHVSAVVRSRFFHIRSPSKVRLYFNYKAASSIAVCLILSKLDYCNSLVSGLPPKQIKRLQAVQNAAARTVMKCKKTIKKNTHKKPTPDHISGMG